MPFLALASPVIALEAAPHAVVPSWNNPVILQRADPWVWREPDGTYYFTATVPEYDRIELRKSKSLEGLASAEPVVVWRKPAEGPASHHIWAPELHRMEGRWYIYFAGGRSDAIWAIRMYALECEDPDPLKGTWVNRGRIETHLDSFSLDATRFVHKGVPYLVWAQHDPSLGGNTCLFIAEMDGPVAIKGPAVMLSRPEFTWETRGFAVNEGAAVLIRNGRIFLTYSASATDANYCIGLLSADEDSDLLDPASWSKSREPVLASSSESRVFGPGHNSFTTLPDGTDVLVYHARDFGEITGDPLNDPNRHTRFSTIRWRVDGYPDFKY